MRMAKPGDRIKLIAMPDDPDPISAGTMGTVVSVDQIGVGREAWLPVDVDWDNGRQLMLTVPPDDFEIVGRNLWRWRFNS